jgi:hypothetical protein
VPSFPRRILFGSAPTIAGHSGQCPCIRDDPYSRQSPCLPDNPYRRQSLHRDPPCNVNIRHVSSRSSQLPGAADDANGQQWSAISGEATHALRGAADRGEHRQAAGTASKGIISSQRDPSRLSEDFPSETEGPRSSCAGTTDTDTFAEFKLASHAKFGRSTSASRIEEKTEQKRAARIPFVRPFESPAGGRQQYPR